MLALRILAAFLALKYRCQNEAQRGYRLNWRYCERRYLGCFSSPTKRPSDVVTKRVFTAALRMYSAAASKPTWGRKVVGPGSRTSSINSSLFESHNLSRTNPRTTFSLLMTTQASSLVSRARCWTSPSRSVGEHVGTSRSAN
jgi:hypothetical protein